MKKRNLLRLYAALALLIVFALWTALLRFIDVQPIGPQGSTVGFAALNGYVHELTGVNWLLYTVTDWLGLVPIAVALGFAILGLVQLIKRIDVMAVYILFEMVIINYRPTLVDGYLEASYPSSTTMLVMCVMSTAMMQFSNRIKNGVFRRCVMLTITVFIAFMVIGRLVSGVHWITDIIGGALISTGLVLTYHVVIRLGKDHTK